MFKKAKIKYGPNKILDFSYRDHVFIHGLILVDKSLTYSLKFKSPKIWSVFRHAFHFSMSQLYADFGVTDYKKKK